MNIPESKPAVRVLIVDDHPVVRAGLASLLRRQARVKLAGSAHSGEEALSILARGSVDLILLDLDLGHESGYELLRIHYDSSHLAGIPVVIWYSTGTR